jgi:hypothetical protein
MKISASFLSVVCAGFFALSAEAATPAAPKISAKPLSTSQVKVSWKLSSSVARMKPNVRIFRSANGGSYKAVAEVEKAKASQSFTDSVPASGSYKYKAIVRKGRTKSKYSNTVTAVVSGSLPPGGTPGSAYFDASGNVTELGKGAFGIPAALSANVGRGQVIVQANCSCHAEKTNRSFSTVKTRTAGTPMFFQFTDPQIADIVAYLNRFR